MSFEAITRRPALLLVLGLCGVGAAVSFLGRLTTGSQAEPKRSAFTNEAGAHAYAAFSADGKQVAYSGHAPGKDDIYHVFVSPAGGGARRQLTSAAGSDIGPVWKPDGSELAFLRADDDGLRVMIMAAGGGEPRQVAQFAAAEDDGGLLPAVAWLHDGAQLAVSGAAEDEPASIRIMDAQSGAMRAITHPAPANPGDFSPSVSPDGKSIAFVRIAANTPRQQGRQRDDDSERSTKRGRRSGFADRSDLGGDIYLCDLNGGGLRRLTFDDHEIRGIAWMPDGKDIVYAANRGNGWRLWRLPVAGGTPHDLMIAGHQAQFPAISKNGRMLFMETAAESSVWMVALDGPGVAVKTLLERPMLRSDAREAEPAIAPDGARLANVSGQNQEQQIWVGDASGMSPRFQLTRLETTQYRRLRWSPDGKQLLYQAVSQRGFETYRQEAAANSKPVKLPFQEAACWSADGKSFYYFEAGALTKVSSADGSRTAALGERRRADSGPELSPDGRFLYYRAWRAIMRAPVDGGREEEVVAPENLMWSRIEPAAGGVYYLEWTRARRSYVLTYYDVAAKRASPMVYLKNIDLSGDGFDVSPDGKRMLYAKTDQNETNLAMVENFR